MIELSDEVARPSVPPGAPPLRSLLLGRTDHLVAQLVRYTLVGGLAFVVDFGLLFTLVEWFRAPVLPSATAAFLCGLVTNYVLSVAWVFAKHRLHNAGLEFGIFAAVGVAGLGINAGVIFALTTWLGVHYAFSKIASTAIVFTWNFAARRAALFSGRV